MYTKNKSKSLLFLLSQIIVVLVVCMEGLGSISEFSSGVIIIAVSFWNVLLLIRLKLLFTPLLFPYLYLFLFGLYELKLRKGMTVMQPLGKLVIVFCMMVWVVLCISSKSVFQRVDSFSRYRFNLKRLKKWILLITAVSLSMMLYEWSKSGGVPALRPDAETFRMSVSQSGITHTLAIMIKIVAVLIEVYWITGVHENQHKCKWFFPLYMLVLLVMWGTANRGELIFAPVLGLIVLWTQYPPKKKTVLFFAILGLLVLAVYPAVRGYSMYGNSYFVQYSAVSTYPILGWFMPLYGTLAYNFEILNRLFETFHSSMPWGYGQYTLLCHVPFLKIGEELWVVQNRIWNNGFYGALTSTYMGGWYADFGYAGCFIGTILICVMNLLLYSQMIKKKNMGSLVAYAYMFYVTLVGSYGDAFNFVFICYEILIALVMNQCEQRMDQIER